MHLITAEPQPKKYKPLIGRGGRIMILLFVTAIVVLSIIYAEPGGRILESVPGLSDLGWQIPRIDWDLGFLSGINFPTGIVAVLAAIFILVLSDTGLSRRKFVF
jgi:hypothetical protein